jgi:hypothetical protein
MAQGLLAKEGTQKQLNIIGFDKDEKALKVAAEKYKGYNLFVQMADVIASDNTVLLNSGKSLPTSKE